MSCYVIQLLNSLSHPGPCLLLIFVSLLAISLNYFNAHPLTFSTIIRGLELRCLTPLSTIFQLYRGGDYYCHKSLTNFITQCCIEYTSPWAEFELTILVVICTDSIGSCKPNYHTITTTKFSILYGVSSEISYLNLTIFQTNE